MGAMTKDRRVDPIDYAELAGIARELVVQAVGGDPVADVLFKRGVDHDGDPILRVMVVFEGDPVPYAKKLVCFGRELRSHLKEEDLFPMVSLISKWDFEEVGFEAA